MCLNKKKNWFEKKNMRNFKLLPFLEKNWNILLLNNQIILYKSII